MDECDGTGNCVFTPIVCDDNDPCTTDECDSAGNCVFTPITCDDGDPCTMDSCDGSGNCVFTPIVCDDGDPQTIDTCINGVCEFIACDDNDPCTIDELVGGVCTYTAIVCDDDDPCTNDSCVSGVCQFIAIDCNDNDPCTLDECDGNGGCINTIIDSDGDGTADCVDECPDDPNKIESGICGCGVVDDPTDTDQDGTPDCRDVCPTDPTNNCCGTMVSIGSLANTTEGSNGTILPAYYNTHQINVGGGTPPYTYDFDRTGYVRWSVSPSDVDGYNEELTIIYADNAEWVVTVTDANGCVTTALIFTNDSGAGGGNASVSSNGDILDIDAFAITGESASIQNGAIDITVVGCGGGPYTYEWTGPGGFTSNAEDIGGLTSGFYEVTVSCGTQVSEGWYWVPKDRRSGRLKTEQTGSLGIFPNPFAEQTTISYSVQEASEVTIEVFDVSGRLLETVFEGEAQANRDYQLPFSNSQLVAGVYLVKMTIGETELVERIVILD